jgi:cytoskeletal protein CcmA (bactofilin family)
MAESEIDVALGEGMAFQGLLVMPKAGRIDGRVSGTVLAGASVHVGPTGVVEADLEADAISVEGRVHGNLYARTSIELGPAAVVTGDLFGPRASIAEGARVDGRFRVGGRPASAPDAGGETPDSRAPAP